MIRSPSEVEAAALVEVIWLKSQEVGAMVLLCEVLVGDSGEGLPRSQVFVLEIVL